MLSGMISPASTIPVARAARHSDWPAGEAGVRTFWAAQGLGWLAYFLVHYAGAVLDNDYAPWWASFASAVAGFVLTGAMRPALNRVWRHGPAVQVLAALGLALVLSVPFSAVSEQAYWIGQGYGWRPNSLADYLGSAFWCGSILLTWAGIYFGLRYYHEAHEQELRAARALSQAKEARLQVLRERLNPHFLFNTLNGISTLLLERDNERAAAMLDQLSALLRRSIDDAPSQQVTLAEELELAELYLAIQQTRFENRLRVEWRIAPESRHLAVPSMILQPLLENAVRYGVQPNAEGVTLLVESRLGEDGRLVLSVTNGRRRPGRPGGQGLGQRIVRERLQALYGDDARLETLAEDERYIARLRLPARALP